MLRSLLALLAVLVAGLAVLFDRPWLYVVTGVILVGALGLLGWWLWTTYTADEPERPRPSPEPDASEPSLDEMGIVDIQPETADADLAQEEPTQEDRTKSEPVESSAPSAPGPALATQKPSADQDETTERPTTMEETEAEPPSDPTNAPVLDPLLESARAALDARTVGLLVQEEVALTYRIEALASTHSAVRRSGSFDTQTPLITATMSRQSVTIRTPAKEEIVIEDLGYYEAPPSVDHLAVAPVSQPDSSTTTFLLADTSEGADLRASRARTLLEHFAETVSLLLGVGRSVPERHAADDPDNGSAEPEEPGSTTMVTDLDGEETEDPRPRSEIITEEMEAAQSASEDLALALVHLNRAESIARRGEEAVASAERLFQARLEQMAPNQRIERFGELTYGIFFRKGAEALEPWMANFESTMAQEQGELEGGVSVGVAVWDEETPEALRSEATKALREAYETGTCTIVT